MIGDQLPDGAVHDGYVSNEGRGMSFVKGLQMADAQARQDAADANELRALKQAIAERQRMDNMRQAFNAGGQQVADSLAMQLAMSQTPPVRERLQLPPQRSTTVGIPGNLQTGGRPADTLGQGVNPKSISLNELPLSMQKQTVNDEGY